MRAPRLALGAIALLWAAAAGAARAAPPTGFDYYLLTLSIAPSFCADHAGKDECRALTEQAFRATPLTVHGLWPNRARVSVNLQPAFCTKAPLGQLSDATWSELRRYMPGGRGLMQHEWQRHGTCSGLSAEAYFATIARLARQANETIGTVMRDGGMLGGPLAIDRLLQGVAVRDAALASAIVVSCGTRRGGGDPVVDEIRVTLSPSLAPIPASSVGLGQNSGCRNGQGRVPLP